MIRFRSLHLHNFHLAHDLSIPFSQDPDKPLSLIRAEPGTGKTTVFRAFRWALYDEEGLPNGGKGYPLGSMAHRVEDDGNAIEVEVELDFESLDVGGAAAAEYKLRRYVTETVAEDGSHSRGRSDLVLQRLGGGGWKTVENPGGHMHRLFPPELRDVFFTDGDEAMRFIAKDVSTSTKRERVRGAIRNLLGINILELAEQHLDQVASQLNAEAKTKGANESLHVASADVEKTTDELKKASDRLTKLTKDQQRVEELRLSAREKLDAALKRGDRAELKRKRDEAEDAQRAAESEMKQVRREKSDVLRSPTVSAPFLAQAIRPALERLATLKSEGAIPSDYIPLLRERLELGKCVCGTHLADGSRERGAIEKLLALHEGQSAVKDRLTQLHYVSMPGMDGSDLARQLESLETRLIAAQKRYEVEGNRIRSIEAQIKQAGDADIAALQASVDDHLAALTKLSSDHGIAENQEAMLRIRLDEVTKKRNKLLESEKDAQALRARLEVTNDIRQVITGAKTNIQDGKLREVSTEMDKLFRRMIGSDSEQSLIKSALLTPDFDVVVESQTGARLDPDMQLNGASRRAITLAFILALATVSGVRSPNVIDTPLGMMGIQVKQAALATLVQESAQPILFLTYAEIRDIEPTLDRYVGAHVTLTMTAHFPTYLANKPPVDAPVILQCACGHNDYCELCERVLTSADEIEAVA